MIINLRITADSWIIILESREAFLGQAKSLELKIVIAQLMAIDHSFGIPSVPVLLRLSNRLVRFCQTDSIYQTASVYQTD